MRFKTESRKTAALVIEGLAGLYFIANGRWILAALDGFLFYKTAKAEVMETRKSK